ncbi:MAG: hypothetical protein RMK57_09495 [Bryobacterales bacterium]|nr:hypothetical protein [Bryobacteraceae bacterium]MDW8354751.1 hypothetical protein [Bryobacterales bacterium]
MWLRCAVGLLTSWLSAAAQLHVGVKAGAPLAELTETVGAGDWSNLPSRWAFGLMVDVDLPADLGIEFNALYRRVGYEGARLDQVPVLRWKARDEVWDFPLIGKYRFPGAVVRPYVGAGIAFRKLNDLMRPGSGSRGPVLSGGLRANVLVLKLSPELRYTRWTGGEDIRAGFRARKNQMEFLLGITF